MAAKRPSVEPPRGKRPADAYHLYVMSDARRRRSDGPRIKIGITEDVLRRVQALSAGNPGGLSVYGTRLVRRADARSLEAALHRRFADEAIGREWFKAEPRAVLQAADELLAALAPPCPVSVAAVEARDAAEMQRRIEKYMPIARR